MKNNHEVVERFRKQFNYSSFTWNGDNATGVQFAKQKQKEVENFLLSERAMAQKEVFEKVLKLQTPMVTGSQDDEETCPNCGENLDLEWYDAFDKGYTVAIQDIKAVASELGITFE